MKSKTEQTTTDLATDSVRVGHVEFVIKEIWEEHHFNTLVGIPGRKFAEFQIFLLEFPGVMEVKYQEPGYWFVETEIDPEGNETQQLGDLRNHCIRAAQKFFEKMLPEESE
jgi:hypothetical protein